MAEAIQIPGTLSLQLLITLATAHDQAEGSITLSNDNKLGYLIVDEINQ